MLWQLCLEKHSMEEGVNALRPPAFVLPASMDWNSIQMERSLSLVEY